jgi:hypothetical protein
MNGARQARKTICCAIYTRKSTEEGFEQDFNSLDAQREACAAYVLSQKHEGWTTLPDRYDDGGWSGGTLERPALARLLAEVDRLTRSLADFAFQARLLGSGSGSGAAAAEPAATVIASLVRLAEQLEEPPRRPVAMPCGN